MRPPGTYIVPTYLPTTLFANQTMAFAVQEDWKKAARIQREGPTRVPLPIEEWQWRPTIQHVARYFDCMRDGGRIPGEPAVDPGPWVLDFEATLLGEPMCMGLWSCYQPFAHQGICIPFLSQGGVHYWSPDEEPLMMEMVFAFLTDPTLKKWGHNLAGYDTGVYPFNWRALAKTAWGIDVLGVEGDTMAAHHVTFAELRHALAFLASMVTDMEPFKLAVWEKDDADEEVQAKPEWARTKDLPDEKLRCYNLKDCASTAEGKNVLCAEMKTLNCRVIHDVLALPLIPIVQEVGYRGMPVDIAKRDDMLFDIMLRRGALASKLLAEGINAYKSPRALGFQLRDMGVPLTLTTDGGQFKTDLEVIGRANWVHNTKREREGKEPRFPFLKTIMEYRKLEKARSGLESLIPCDDGMLRTRLQAIGTTTARYASAGFGTKTKPGWCPICKCWGMHGTNLQNIPKDNEALGVNVKEIFVAHDGWLLGELDYKAFELVIQAHRICSRKMIERLETPGADPHSLHAKLMYPAFDKNTPDGKRQRGTMKNVIYGLRGGGGNRALLNAMAKKDEYYEITDMVKFRAVIEREYPEMPLWIASTERMLDTQLATGQRRIIRNALGRPRVLFGRRPLKEALATEISGTAAEIMNCVFLRLATYQPEVFHYVCLQVHDSIIVHAPQTVFWSVMEAVKTEMERVVWMWGSFVKFGVDMKYGEQWSGMKEVV